jgi:hypothetical protein
VSKIQVLDFRLSPWSEYCFLFLGYLHGVRSKFTDDVWETAVVPIQKTKYNLFNVTFCGTYSYDSDLNAC